MVLGAELMIILFTSVEVMSAEKKLRDHDALIAEGWETIGGFKGAAGTALMNRVNNLLFEQEANGSLYRDLGDITLGLGFSTDHARVQWDNSFYRRVLPIHEDIEPGGTITGDDLSSYLDIKTLISRGRLNYNYITGEDGALGVEGEGGVSLTLGRIHPALHLGDRPLQEALADPERQIPDLTREWPKGEHKSLIRLGTEGTAWLTNWIASGIGDKSIDTARSEIFYRNYDESITLFIDLEIPVEAELFTAEDTRLNPGDFVRQITFVGLSPIAAGIRRYGVEISYRRFYRFLRETTVVKEPGGTVLVRVRTGLAKGDETTPLRIRPEIRVLGILTLGYTFFEQIYSNGDSTNFDAMYRINLEDPRGMECFKALLGDGTEVLWRPLHEAAIDRDGAERLGTEIRNGDNRSSLRRFRCFSLFNKRDWRVASIEDIDDGTEPLREIIYARDSSSIKRIGKDRDESRKFLIRALHNPVEKKAAEALGGKGEAAVVIMITGVRNYHASGKEVQESAELVRRTLPWDEHSVLQELESVDPEIQTRFLLNLRLALGTDSMRRIEAATTDEVWTELADILLGNVHRDAWRSEEQRKSWRRSRRAARRDGVSLVDEDAVSIHGKDLSVGARYRVARRAVKKFSKLQAVSNDGDCVACLTKSLDRWKYTTLMQMLLARLGNGDGDSAVGYHYELFIDEMLRPRTVTNHVQLTAPVRMSIGDVMKEAVVGNKDDWQDLEHAEENLTRERAGWQGDRFLQPSLARLQGGNLLINTGNVPPPGASPLPCLVLRIYSDARFDEDLSLRVDLRESRGFKIDIPLGYARFPIGEPSEVISTPFMASQYSYDIPMPLDENLVEGEAYSLLLRVLNAGGLTVSEEQQVRLVWPEGGLDRAAKGCYSPQLIEP